MPSTKEIETLSFIDLLEDMDNDLVVLLEEMNIPVKIFNYYNDIIIKKF